MAIIYKDEMVKLDDLVLYKCSIREKDTTSSADSPFMQITTSGFDGRKTVQPYVGPSSVIVEPSIVIQGITYEK